MNSETMGSTWITIVLITVVAILVFMVFFSKNAPVRPESTAPAVEQSSPDAQKTQLGDEAAGQKP